MHAPRRSTSLPLILTTCTLAVLSPTQTFGRAPDGDRDADLALVDPELAKLGIAGARQASPTDAVASAPFRWNFPRLDAARLAAGETLLFILPGGRELELPLVERLVQAEDSVVLLFADHENAATAEICLTGGLVTGRVRHAPKTGPEEWILATGEDEFGIGGEYWSEAPASLEIIRSNSTESSNGLEGETDGGVAGGCIDNGSTIDLLIAYTPAALANFGGNLEALKATVASDIAIANQSLSASRSIPRIRIAGYWAAPNNTTGDVLTDLNRLKAPTDGWNDGVHAQRNGFSADLVMLYLAPSAQGGAADRGLVQPQPDANAFSVNAAPGSYVAAKLFGFNLGACSEISSGCEGYFDYSNAWLFTVNGALRGTVMVAQPVNLYPIYSNIYIQVSGVATGDETANNARTLSLTASTVAKYRCSTVLDNDCNNNGLLDSAEIASGAAEDCNGTGFPDECDIAFGFSDDADGDDVPDECPLQDVEFALVGAVQLDMFGTGVSISSRPLDPTVLLGIGTPGDDTLLLNSGEAFVLSATGGVIDPSSEALLRPHDPQTNAYFGRSVSVMRRPARTDATDPVYNYPARNLVLVSAFRWYHESSQGNYPSKGACYLFAQNADGSWTQIQSPGPGASIAPWRVTPPAGITGAAAGANALFGYSTAIGHAPNEVAEVIAVGAPGREDGRGAVYVYRNQSVTVGNFTTDRVYGPTLLSLGTTADAGDLFGSAVAIEDQIQTSGTTPRIGLIIGAPGRNESRGYAVIRERATSTNSFASSWSLTTQYVHDLSSPSGSGAPLQPGFRYGEAVAIEGRLAVVGAPGASDGKGRIYIWERNTLLAGSWSFRGWIAPDDPLVRGFGNAVSIARTDDPNEYRILVGSSKADIAAGSVVRVDAGAVFIYAKSIGSSPATLLGMRISNTPGTGDEFGYSTSAIPNFGLVGAPFKDATGLNAGAVKFIQLP